MYANLEKVVLELIDQAAERLMEARCEEGTTLAKDLQKRFQICDEKIEQIRILSEQLMATVKKNIDEKLVQVEAGDAVARLQLEDLYATLNKVDVHEEITRFKSHLHAIQALLQSEKKASF